MRTFLVATITLYFLANPLYLKSLDWFTFVFAVFFGVLQAGGLIIAFLQDLKELGKKEDGDICKRGHSLNKNNIYYRKQGWRVCKQCAILRQQKYVTKRNKVEGVG